VDFLLDLEGYYVDKCDKGRAILHRAQQGHETKENVFLAINVCEATSEMIVKLLF